MSGIDTGEWIVTGAVLVLFAVLAVAVWHLTTVHPPIPAAPFCYSYELQREQPATWLVRQVECP